MNAVTPKIYVSVTCNLQGLVFLNIVFSRSDCKLNQAVKIFYGWGEAKESRAQENPVFTSQQPVLFVREWQIYAIR